MANERNYFDVLQTVDDAEDDAIYITQHEKKYAEIKKLYFLCAVVVVLSHHITHPRKFGHNRRRR